VAKQIIDPNLIIDPPYRAAYDIDVARAWVKELELRTEQGYDVEIYMPQAKKDLARLENFKPKKSPT
jgi:hypothetical protein